MYVCMYVCMYVYAMGKLSSKLRKSENNTDISLYLPKLHENILKCYF